MSYPRGFYIAYSFSGTGFKIAPAVGACMAELIVHGHASSIDISMLDAKRFDENRQLKSRYGMAVLA